MKRYVVTNTILSRAEGATPADVTYYRGENPTQALLAVGQAMTLSGDDTSLPESMKFDVTGVRLDIFEVPDATGSRVCAACDEEVPDDDSHPSEWMCSNPECGIWFHVGGTERCPRCGAKGAE